jgi:three-Cys-motif partner protein
MLDTKPTELDLEPASPHTVKKFELIESYVKAWAQKLLNFKNCDTIVFIDCMCNSGVYADGIIGTPIRVARYLSSIMPNYPEKHARLYFNDLSADKIALLKTHLPVEVSNFHIQTSCGDGNDLLKSLKANRKDTNYLLVYDPYQAIIDWAALMPFLRNWGEVIINHMGSDPIRGIPQAKSEAVIAKYERTYLTSIQELYEFKNDRSAYEKRVKEIITDLHSASERRYYIASFPFFNTRNALVYNLLHCSGNIEGFKLFKKTVWQTFGGKSSSKDTHGNEDQLMMSFGDTVEIKTKTDEYCYYVSDIVTYVHEHYKGRTDVPFTEVWALLDEHPFFPSEGYRTDIKNGLKSTYRDTISKQTISFNGRA